MRKTILVVAIAIGLLVALCGPLLGVVLAGVAWLGPGAGGDLVQSAAIALALVVLGFGLGVALAWAAWRALRGGPNRAFFLPHWGWWLAAIGLVLVVGQAALSAGLHPLAPVFQLLAGTLPPFFFLALAAWPARRQADRIGWRAAVGGLAWGGLGGAGLALGLETMLVLAAVLAVVFGLAVMDPDLLARLQVVAAEMGASGTPTDLSPMMPLVTSPWIILGGLTLIAVFVPLIEEAAKGLAIPLAAAAGRRLARLDAFLLGVAAGAGFALLEGIGYGQLALASTGSWAALMAIRGGAAAVHCLATGLSGLGWQAVLAERRWGRGLALGALAISIHGMWNMAAGISGFSGLSAPARAGGTTSVLGPPMAAAALASMAVLWLAAVVALGVIPGVLAAEHTASKVLASRSDIERDREALSVSDERGA